MKHAAKAVARHPKEAGGRRVVNQLPYWVVLVGIGVGLATMRGNMQSVKSGTLVIAGALLAGDGGRDREAEGRAGKPAFPGGPGGGGARGGRCDGPAIGGITRTGPGRALAAAQG